MIGDLERVEQRIAEVRTELTRLETARDVLTELAGLAPRRGGKSAAASAAHAGGSNGKAFTIRRVAVPDAKPASNGAHGATPVRSKPRVSREAIRAKITEALKDGPASSGELAKRFGFKAKAEKQSLYQVMWELKTHGKASKGADERYALVNAH